MREMSQNEMYVASLDEALDLRTRIKELEGIASCLLDSYVVSFASGDDALAIRAKRAIPNWRQIADEFNPTIGETLP